MTQRRLRCHSRCQSTARLSDACCLSFAGPSAPGLSLSGRALGCSAVGRVGAGPLARRQWLRWRNTVCCVHSESLCAPPLQGVDVIHMKAWLESRGAAVGGVAMRHFDATLRHTHASAGDQRQLEAWRAEFGAE